MTRAFCYAGCFHSERTAPDDLQGKNLGAVVTEEQKANIKNGTFKGFFLGDYWTIGSYTWRIVDFDYWYNCGDTAFTTPHLVIMPDKPLYNAQMNETNITTGGYTGSLMYTENLDQAKTLAASAFGDLILTHREYLTNAVTDGHASAGAWFDSTLDLPNEIMMYGCHVYAAMNNGTVIPTNYTIGKTQLALFTVVPKLISNRATFWLRDVVSSAYFAVVGYGGNTAYGGASYSLEFVRSSLLVSLNPGALCPVKNRTQVTTICVIKRKTLKKGENQNG